MHEHALLIEPWSVFMLSSNPLCAVSAPVMTLAQSLHQKRNRMSLENNRTMDAVVKNAVVINVVVMGDAATNAIATGTGCAEIEGVGRSYKHG